MSEYLGVLLSEMEGRVFHYTSIQGYQRILSGGYIDSNLSGTEFRWGHTSFAIQERLTSFFDFFSYKEKVDEYFYRSSGVFRFKPFGVVIELKTSLIGGKILTYKDMESRINLLGSPQHIPYIESYSSRAVSIDDVINVYLLNTDSAELKLLSDTDFTYELECNLAHEKKIIDFEKLILAARNS